MMKVLWLAILVLCSLASLGDLSDSNTIPRNMWSDCSHPTDKLKFNKATIQPNPPQKGQNVTVTIDYTLNERITGGSVHVLLYCWQRLYINETLNLCNALNLINLSCPLNPGDNSFTYTSNIPDYIPTCLYTGQVVIYDQNSRELHCIKVKVDI